MNFSDSLLLEVICLSSETGLDILRQSTDGERASLTNNDALMHYKEAMATDVFFVNNKLKTHIKV